MMKISSAATMAFMVVLLCGCTGARSDMWDPEPVFGGDGGEEGDAADHEASGDIQGDGAPDGEGPGDQPADPEAPFDAPHDVPPDGDIDLCEQPCNDGIDCTIDSCDPARGCIFTPANERCNDGIDCTVDTCDALTGCIFAPVDARCNDAIPCTVDTCLPGTGCVFTPEDALCSDGIDCTLDRCDLSAGACTSTPRHDLCADDVDCTVDRCDPAAGCLNTPDDSLCGPGERCEPDCGGCILDVAPAGRFLAHSSSSLYQIDPAAPSSTAIGDIGFSVTDIAVTEDNMLWGITYDSLLSIDYCTGIGRYVGNVGSTSTLNALVAAPGGVLFGADYSGDVWRIDPVTAAGTRIGNYGPGLHSSGDIAWGPDGLLYGTVTVAWSSNDLLISVDPATGSANVIGNIGFARIYGLAVLAGVLYGLTDSGQLITINRSTGGGTLVATIGSSYWGAASPPPRP
jgi:hypothetical protein